MTITNTDTTISDDEWTERWCAAAAPHLHKILDQVPADSAPLDVRANAVTFALKIAHEQVAQSPTEAASTSGRALIEAVEEVDRQRPRAKVARKRIPQTVRSTARLASALALNPAMADEIPADLVPALDAMLGRVQASPAALATYFEAIEAAREELAQACEMRLGWISVEYRREANAPTRAEAEAVRRFELESGGVFA